jgi:hypothetical protein
MYVIVSNAEDWGVISPTTMLEELQPRYGWFFLYVVL